MSRSTWLFQLMPIQVLEGTEALEVAHRAVEEHNDGWVPMTKEPLRAQAWVYR